VNWQHFRAFLWLRWRLRLNQMRRGGIVNFIVLMILAAIGVIASVVLFFVLFFVGLWALKDASPAVLMYVWDGMVAVFLFLWITGLITELQRYEALSLEKLLHLPVSLTSAFLINYLNSLSSLILLLFLPAMLGLWLGLLFSWGWAMLLLLPLLAAFILMVTALTYQFQGWLATMMTNPRRRRTVIAVVTIVFVLIFQLPNLLNIMIQRNIHQTAEERAKLPPPPPVPLAKQKGVEEREQEKKHRQQLEQRQREIEERNREAETQTVQKTKEMASLLNTALPPGWLPLGAMTLGQGQVWQALLGTLGLTLIGTASLWRAYRTTLRLHRGEYTSGRAAAVSRPVALRSAERSATGRVSPGLLERKLPWLSEQTAAIALAAFRSLLRAPEGKMILLTPLILMVVFSSMFVTGNRADFPQAARPLLAFGAMTMVMVSMMHLIGNQFGFDRNGFRVYVLSPARRRDILVGKNLAIAPIALTIGAAVALVVQFVYPMSLNHFLALGPTFVSMYLLYCLPANALSILSPMRIAAGSFQPSRPGGLALVWQFAFLFVCPPVLALALVPLGIDSLVAAMDWLPGLPLDLILSVVECGVIVYFYRLLVDLEGDWLQAREQRILEVVTTRAE
jgi:ABC-2 type transport system permease protein